MKKTFNKFIKMAVNSGRLPEDETGDMLEILKKLNFIIDDKITNAAIMLSKIINFRCVKIKNFDSFLGKSAEIFR